MNDILSSNKALCASKLYTNLYPSRLMFEPPSSAIFNTEKQQYLLNALPIGYEGETTEQKWRQLINAFKGILPSSFKTSIESLQRRRLNTIDTNSVIRLHQMLDYFETFFFLYGSEHPNYSLDTDKKRAFLSDLTLALEEACEPGKQQKFESIIRYYRRDLNWISNILYQLRHQQLEGIKDAYNAENFNEAFFQSVRRQHPEWANDGIEHRFDLQFRLWEPHTLSVMSELAQTRELGIEIVHVIDDLYMRDDSEEKLKITAFFNKRYKEAFFYEYPSIAIEALAQHCLDEIVNMLKAQEKGIDLTQWSEQPLAISLPAYRQFRDLLDGLFSEKNNPLSELIGYDDDSVSIINQLDAKKVLKKYVTEKLVKQGYMHDLFSANNRLDKPELFHSEIYPIINTLKNLLVLSKRKDQLTASELQAFLLSHEEQLRNFPPFFYDIFVEQPQQVYDLPVDVRRNYHFSKQLVAAFERYFDEHKKVTHAQSAALSYLYQNDPSIITFMPKTMLANPILVAKLLQVRKEASLYLDSEAANSEVLALSLIEQDPLLIFSMSETNRSKATLLNTALKKLNIKTDKRQLKNYDDFIQCLNQNYAKAYNRHGLRALSQNQVCSYRENLTVDEHQKLLALDALLTQTSISPVVLQQYLGRLRPDTVLWALQQRKNYNLAVLPGCNLEQLQKFIQYYEEASGIDKTIFGLDAWCSSSFQTLREKALDNYYNEPVANVPWFAVSSLTTMKSQFFKYVFITSDNWFEGFCQFQRVALNRRRSFYHISEVFEQLLVSAKLLLISGGLFLYGLGGLVVHLLHLLLRAALLVASCFAISFVFAYLLSWVIPWPLFDLWINTNRVMSFILTVILNTDRNELPNNAFGYIISCIMQACEFIFSPAVLYQFKDSLIEFFRLFWVEVELIYEAFAAVILRAIESFKTTDLSLPLTVHGIIERLTSKQDHISQQKAELLQNIWAKLQMDPGRGLEKLSSDEILNKPYKILHLGEMIECSFNEAAKSHRNACKNNFKPSEISSTQFGFFKNKTDSEKELERLIESEVKANTASLEYAL